MMLGETSHACLCFGNVLKKKSQTIFAFQKVLLQSEGNFSCGSTADYVQL